MRKEDFPFIDPSREQRTLNLEVHDQLKKVKGSALEELQSSNPEAIVRCDFPLYSEVVFTKSRLNSLYRINLREIEKPHPSLFNFSIRKLSDEFYLDILDFLSRGYPFYTVSYREMITLYLDQMVSTPYQNPYASLESAVIDAEGKAVEFWNTFLFTADGHSRKIEHVQTTKKQPSERLGLPAFLEGMWGDRITRLPFSAKDSDTRVIPMSGSDFERVEYYLSLLTRPIDPFVPRSYKEYL